MRLQLSELPAAVVAGTYGRNDKKHARWRGKKPDPLRLETSGTMPARALFAHPLVAISLLNVLIPAGVVVSDLLRTIDSSLRAVLSGRGAQPPGFSLHNFGLAIDIDIAATMARMRASGARTADGREIKTKRDLDDWTAERGWCCHRTDHELASEAWHYNALFLFPAMGFTKGPIVIDPRKYKATSGFGEQLIRRIYGDQLAPDDAACQRALASLGFYRGEIDGDAGPLTRTAVAAFQRAWGRGAKVDRHGNPVTANGRPVIVETLRQDGRLDARTRRTIAVATAERQLVALPPATNVQPWKAAA